MPITTMRISMAMAMAMAMAMMMALALPLAATAATRKAAPPAPAVPPAPPSVCAAQAGACMETRSFAALVTGMRTSQSGSSRFVTVTVRFHNRTDAPLALGYVSGSGLVTDDQGNRYEIAGPDAVRAIGIVAPGAADAKFALQPGETGDARFEFSTKLAGRSSSKNPAPATYALDLAVREIDTAGTPGREHAVQFASLDPTGAPAGGAVAAAAGAGAPAGTAANAAAAAAPSSAASSGNASSGKASGTASGVGAALANTAVAAGGAVLAAKAAGGAAGLGASLPGSMTGTLAGMLPGAAASAATSAVPAAAAATQAVPAVAGSACAGSQFCYDAGPFVAEITQVTSTAMTPGARHHSLGMNVRFRNTGTQPLILAYKASTGGAVDNFGAAYTWGRPGTHDTSAQGIGLSAGRSIDPQFVLQPGQASAATFGLIRFNAAGTPIGNAFTYRLVVQEVRLAGGQIAQVAREHSLTFANVTPGSFAVSGGGLGAAIVPTGSGQAGGVAQQVLDIFKSLPKK